MFGPGCTYLHEDALGSTRLVVTSTLTVTFSSNYVPYGPNYAISGKEVFMYTGKPYDTVTGLYYFAARYYDPSLGRFITEDSYNGTKTDPLSMNRYSYAVENPMKYVDPSGHVISCGGCGGGNQWVELSSITMVLVLGDNQVHGVIVPSAALSGTWTSYVNWSTGQYYLTFSGNMVTAAISAGGTISLGAPIQFLSVSTTGFGFSLTTGGTGDSDRNRIVRCDLHDDLNPNSSSTNAWRQPPTGSHGTGWPRSRAGHLRY
jgi:RHS repeat-associated protein